MSRRARTRTSILGFGLLFLALPLWLSTRGAAHSSTGSTKSGSTRGGGNDALRSVSKGDGLPSGFVVPADFPCTLIRAGLDPAAIAAAGVLSGTVSSILQAAADTINAHPMDLPNADTAFAAARVDSDRLRILIQSGRASQEDITAYQTAMANLATATSQRQAALDQIFTSAIANLPAGQRTVITQVRTNRASDFSKDFPTEFVTVDRTQETWVSVRDCLANEHIGVTYPETLDQGAQAQLAAWRADPTVSAAKNALDANLASVTAAWNAAAGVQ